MKKISTYFGLTLILMPVLLSSQVRLEETITPNKNVHAPHGIVPSAGHFTGVTFEKSDCLSDEQRFLLEIEAEENKARILQNTPEVFSNLGSSVLFVEPQKVKDGFGDYGYHTLNFLVDHNPAPNDQLLDYYCGTRTYDWATGNHAGSDYILWPYPWRRMQEDTMEIVAAAQGVIVVKRDGFYDLNCLNNGNPNWNGITLEHADGTRTIYMHFKNGAITSKEVGDVVEAGEFLGIAGSSGSSTIPHLHFEVRDSGGNVIDPYEGACNSFNSQSWWIEQEDYYVPRINRISTHNSTNHDTECPVVENTYEELNFNPGDLWVLKLFFRDIRNDIPVNFNIVGPDGNTFMSWTWVSNWGVFYATGYGYWYNTVTSSWPQGVYNAQVTFEGNTYETIFGVGTDLNINDQNFSTVKVYPNPVSDVLYIQNPDNSIIESLTVLGIDGRVFIKQKSDSNKAEINVNQLSKGVYLVRIKAGGKYFTHKIIKN